MFTPDSGSVAAVQLKITDVEFVSCSSFNIFGVLGAELSIKIVVVVVSDHVPA